MQRGKRMKKYVIIAALAILTLSFAVLEGLVEGLPVQLVQLSGLLTILCTAAFIGWTLKTMLGQFTKDQ
jgi:hypothetical protein